MTELEEKYKVLQRKYLQLNIALDNIDKERIFLREQLARMHKASQDILDISRHYEGQQNVYTSTQAALNDVNGATFSGPVLVVTQP